MSDEKHNYLREGFYARSLEEEKPCYDLELNVLISIEDVTERVNSAVRQGASPEEAFTARRRIIAQIEKESYEKTGLRSDVITLYQGGAYHLYRFKRYTDVRLVFARNNKSHSSAATPITLNTRAIAWISVSFRVYENGKPAKITHWLKWNKIGVSDNELIFVSGHPGNTDRLLTIPELEYLRDNAYPYTLERLNRLEVLLNSWGQRTPENARRAMEDLFGVQNSRKARRGGLDGLLDPQFFVKKQQQDQQLQNEAAKRTELKDCADAWEKIAQAQKIIDEHSLEYRLLEGANGFNSELFRIARTLLRSTIETAKPDGERLREYRDSAKPSLELRLFSAMPIYEDYEEIKLADSLRFLVAKLGWSNPLTQKIGRQIAC
jgi:hypothetical protein